MDSMRRAEEYYTFISEKKAEAIKNYLHQDVEFFGPLAHLKGQQAVLEATNHFMKLFSSLTIRAKFGSENQAMIVYDTNISGIATHFPGASLLQFREGLIVRIELFYDGSRFLEKRKQIFS